MTQAEHWKENYMRILAEHPGNHGPAQSAIARMEADSRAELQFSIHGTGYYQGLNGVWAFPDRSGVFIQFGVGGEPPSDPPILDPPILTDLR
jgi:hypothetical protein